MNQKILIVDDDQAQLLFYQKMLDTLCVDIYTALSGERAIEKAESEDFDLVLMDVCLPGIDGFETVKAIKNSDKNKLTPIIFITGVEKTEQKAIQGLGIGAIDYINKTVSNDILTQKITNLLKLEKIKKELKAKEQNLTSTINELEFREIELKKSEEEALRLSEEKHRILFNDSPVPHLIISEGIIIDCNKAAEKILLLNKNQILGMTPFDLSPEFQPNGRTSIDYADEKIFEAIKSGFNNFEWTHRRSDNTEFIVDVRLAEISLKGKKCLIATWRDITKKKHIEKEKDKLAYNLNERVKELKCLYSISSIIETPEISLEAALQQIAEAIPSGFQYPDITCSRIIIDDKQYATENFIDTKWSQSSAIIVNGQKKGLLTICYLECNQDYDESPCLKEVEDLIKIIAEQLGRLVEQKSLETELSRMLNFRQNVIDSIPATICVINKSGEIVSVNQLWNDFMFSNSPVPQNAGVGSNYYTVCENALGADKKYAIEALEGLKKLSNKEISNFILEYPCHSKTQLRWFLLNASCLDQDFMVLHHFDITSIKVLQESVIEREERFRVIATTAQDSIIMIDNNGLIIFWNSASESIFGYKAEEVIGENLHKLIAPSRFHNASSKAFAHFQSTGEGNAIGKLLELSALRKNGEEFPIELSLSAIKTNIGWHSVGIIRDITERKKSERILSETNQYLESLISYANVPIIVWDDKFIIRRFNLSFEKLTGKKKESVIGENLGVLFPVDSTENSMNLLRKSTSDSRMESIEIAIANTDGSVKYVLWNSANIYTEGSNAPTATIAQGYDITEHKKTEEQLKISQEQVSGAFKFASVGMLLTLSNGHFIKANPAICNILGYTEEELLSSSIPNITYPDDIDISLAKYNALIKGEIATYQLEKRYIRKTGEVIWCLLNVSSVRNMDGYIIYTVAQVVDISARKKAEEELNNYKAHLEVLVNERTDELRKEKTKLLKAQQIAHVGTWEYSNERDSLIFTSETASIFSLESVEEISLQSFQNLILLEDRQRFVHNWDFLLAGKSIDEVFRFFLKGSIRYIRIIANLVYDKEKNWKAILGYVFDLTKQISEEKERKAIEARIHLNQKIESIGLLSAGVAHNFNNILNAIMGSVELFMSEYPEEGKNKSYLKNAIVQGQRAGALVSQLLSYSQPDTNLMKVTDMSVLVKEAYDSMKSYFRKIKIECNLTIDSSDFRLIADPQQIQQLLLNMFKNAVDAMEEKGGMIGVDLRDISFTSDTAIKYGIDPGSYIVLKICDNGHGMTAEVIDRIFEPFFSTKEVGKGAGLGLFTVNSTVKNHKGKVMVDSEPGKGTTFTFYFHSLEKSYYDKNAESKETSLGKKDLIPSSIRILIAEDEIIIREIYKFSLSKKGYHVTLASDGLEALDIFKKNPDNYDLILTDQIMPRMEGIELCKEAKKIRPDLPVLLVTGYSNQSEIDANTAGVTRFFRKPIAVAALSKVVEEVMAGRKI